MQYTALKTDTIFPPNMTPEGQAVADAQSTSDYFPFGSPLPGRGFDGGSYRFGFNGQEKDGEISGIDGVNYDFEFREYDSRLGRFLIVDPLEPKYPYNSPYAFCENRVIDCIEFEGLEKVDIDEGNSTITITNTTAYFTGSVQGSKPQDFDISSFKAREEGAISGEKYSLTITENNGIMSAKFGGKLYTVNFVNDFIEAVDVVDLESKQEYRDAIADGSYSGVLLFGTSFTNSNGETKSLDSDVPAAAYPNEKLPTGNNNHYIVLLNPKATAVGDYDHEIAHTWSLGHMGHDNFQSQNGNLNYFDLRMNYNSNIGYNGKGLMAYSGRVTAPLWTQVLNIINNTSYLNFKR